MLYAWLPGAGLAGRLAGHCRAGHCGEDAVAWRRGRRRHGRHTTASAGSGCRQAASSGPTGGSWPYAAMLRELSPARNGCSTCCIGSLPHKRQRIPRPLARPSSGDGYHVRRSAVRKAVTICRAARGPTATRGALQRQNGHRPHSCRGMPGFALRCRRVGGSAGRLDSRIAMCGASYRSGTLHGLEESWKSQSGFSFGHSATTYLIFYAIWLKLYSNLNYNI